ncbi:MAG: nucleotidyltransferase domain-containing protein [Bacteroidia bacterium]|nr:nucleotidyltransferase domain-containing protein [Bacteroidia bacterium]
MRIEADVLQKLNTVFGRYPNIAKVKLYGSRAKGSFRNGSDIDLALIGSEVDHRQLVRISRELDDLMLPYSFDITNYSTISNVALKDHIDRMGKVLFINEAHK